MRNSPLRHPVAVLRTQLGLTQGDLGRLVGRAARTIQSVELGKMPLCEALARRIAAATGVAVGWLLDGDPTLPPRTEAGTAFSRADYERYRAGLEVPATDPTAFDADLLAAMEQLLTATRQAPAARLVRWKLRRWLAALAAEQSGTMGSSGPSLTGVGGAMQMDLNGKGIHGTNEDTGV